MSYAPTADRPEFVPDPRRVLLGIIVAPVAPSLVATLPQSLLPSFGALATLGLLSVLTLFLPLILWRLPHTRHPFWTCVLLGGFSAPGLFGYLLALVLGITAGAPAAPLFVLLATFPLGAVGGAIFWLCVVWRSDGWA